VSAPQLGGAFVSQPCIQTPSQNGINLDMIPFTAPHAGHLQGLRISVPNSPTPPARLSDANVSGFRRPNPPRRQPEGHIIDVTTDSSNATTTTAKTEDYSTENTTASKLAGSTHKINAAAAEFRPNGALQHGQQTEFVQANSNAASWNRVPHQGPDRFVHAGMVPPPPPRPSTPVQQPPTVHNMPLQPGFFLHQMPQHIVQGSFVHNPVAGPQPGGTPETNTFGPNQHLQLVSPEILRALDGPTGNLQRLNLVPPSAPQSKELSRLLETSGGIKIENVMSDEFFPFVPSPSLGGQQVDWGVIKIANVSSRLCTLT